MNLDTTTRSIEIVLAGAITTNQLPVTTDWVDIDQTTFGVTADSCTATATNNTTAVTIAAAPASGKTRRVTNIEIENIDTAPATVTVQLNDNSTIRKKITITLPVNATLQYTQSSGWNTVNGAAASAIAGVNNQTGTAYTLAIGDANFLVNLSNASPVTLTVPTNASVAFPVPTTVFLQRKGAGSLTVAGAGGVTVNQASSLTARAQYSVLTLIQDAANTWVLTGDMT